MVRSIFWRWRPRRSLVSMPGRAMRGMMPRWRGQRRSASKSYPLSAWSLTSRRRRGPRRDRMAGMPMTRGRKARQSLVFAALMATARGAGRRRPQRRGIPLAQADQPVHRRAGPRPHSARHSQPAEGPVSAAHRPGTRQMVSAQPDRRAGHRHRYHLQLDVPRLDHHPPRPPAPRTAYHYRRPADIRKPAGTKAEPESRL